MKYADRYYLLQTLLRDVYSEYEEEGRSAHARIAHRVWRMLVDRADPETGRFVDNGPWVSEPPEGSTPTTVGVALGITDLTKIAVPKTWDADTYENPKMVREMSFVRWWGWLCKKYEWLSANPVYVQQVGERLTTKITMFTQPDPYPYTIVSGSDILDVYRDGPESCMSGGEDSLLAIYAGNPERVRLAVQWDEYHSAPIGRALLWTSDQGDVLLDRIYTENNHTRTLLFRKWASEQGYTLKEQDVVGTDWVGGKRYTVTLKMPPTHVYPYLDTFTYIRMGMQDINVEAGTLTLHNAASRMFLRDTCLDPEVRWRSVQSTDGNAPYEMVECMITGDTYPFWTMTSVRRSRGTGYIRNDLVEAHTVMAHTGHSMRSGTYTKPVLTLKSCVFEYEGVYYHHRLGVWDTESSTWRLLPPPIRQSQAQDVPSAVTRDPLVIPH